MHTVCTINLNFGELVALHFLNIFSLHFLRGLGPFGKHQGSKPLNVDLEGEPD